MGDNSICFALCSAHDTATFRVGCFDSQIRDWAVHMVPIELTAQKRLMDCLDMQPQHASFFCLPPVSNIPFTEDSPKFQGSTSPTHPTVPTAVATKSPGSFIVQWDP